MTLPTNRAPGARGLQLPDGRRRLAVAPGPGDRGLRASSAPGRCPTVPRREDVAAGPPGTHRAQPASSPGPRVELAPAGPPRTLGVARPAGGARRGPTPPGRVPPTPGVPGFIPAAAVPAPVPRAFQGPPPQVPFSGRAPTFSLPRPFRPRKLLFSSQPKP